MDAPTVKLGMRNDRARNLRCIEKACWENKAVKGLRESFKKRTGIDIKDEKAFPVIDGAFDYEKAHTKMMESARFQEADSVSSFLQLTRAGVQTIVNSMYQTVQTTFEDWAHVVNTDMREVLFAPLHGIAFPRQIGPQEAYAEVGAQGLDIKLRIRKFGSIYPVELELMRFDQTGQIAQQASLLGEYLKLVAEVYCYGKLASVANMAYSNLQVPISETKPATESVYPWSTGLVGGGKTRPASYGVLNQANLQSADIQLMNQLNLLGLKMSARGTRVVVGPKYKFDTAVLLNSSFFPTAQTTGTGTFQSINPISGLYNVTVSRFMFDQTGSVNANSSAWYLMDDTKPWFVVTMSEAAVVEQEAPNAGQSFDLDIVRFKGRTQLNADFIDPRFAFQGSDGSV